jgi:hypothetical protein
MACKSTEYFNYVTMQCMPISGVSSTGTSSKNGIGIVDTIASNLGSTLAGAGGFIAVLKGNSTAPVNNYYQPPNSGNGNMLLIIGVIVVALLAFLMLKK